MSKKDPKETLDSARELAKQLGSNTSAVQAYLKVKEKVRDIQKEMVDLVKEEAIKNNDQVKQDVIELQDDVKEIKDLLNKILEKL